MKIEHKFTNFIELLLEKEESNNNIWVINYCITLFSEKYIQDVITSH